MKTVQELIAEARRCAKDGTASDSGTHDAVLWLCDAIEQQTAHVEQVRSTPSASKLTLEEAAARLLIEWRESPEIKPSELVGPIEVLDEALRSRVRAQRRGRHG
jgi:hypothetical protein